MGRERILVVEDNSCNLELVSEILHQRGYVVTTATTAEAGISAARELLPDLILMDLGLPGMDGLEATRILKAEAETRDLCVVALSAFASPEDIANARRQGCDGFIAKPIELHRFCREVAEFLAARERPQP